MAERFLGKEDAGSSILPSSSGRVDQRQESFRSDRKMWGFESPLAYQFESRWGFRKETERRRFDSDWNCASGSIV